MSRLGDDRYGDALRGFSARLAGLVYSISWLICSSNYGDESPMAFECGMLGTSRGQSPEDVLVGLMGHLRGSVPGITFEEVNLGDGWAATRVRARGVGDSIPGQYVQVSVGGVILDIYLEAAREVIEKAELADKDLMLTITLSGDVDMALTESFMRYAQAEWRGIPWDEASGFAASA